MSNVSTATSTEPKNTQFPIGQKFKSSINNREYMLCEYELGVPNDKLFMLSLCDGKLLYSFLDMNDFVNYIHSETNLVPI